MLPAKRRSSQPIDIHLLEVGQVRDSRRGAQGRNTTYPYSPFVQIDTQREEPEVLRSGEPSSTESSVPRELPDSKGVGKGSKVCYKRQKLHNKPSGIRTARHLRCERELEDDSKPGEKGKDKRSKRRDDAESSTGVCPQPSTVQRVQDRDGMLTDEGIFDMEPLQVQQHTEMGYLADDDNIWRDRTWEDLPSETLSAPTPLCNAPGTCWCSICFMRYMQNYFPKAYVSIYN